MSITQFLRIIWAYKRLIFLLTVACATVATVTVNVIKPRYEAQSRVMLDIIKPDPVTGQVMATAFLRAYTKTQIELVKDPQTTRIVVEDQNLQRDPKFAREYRRRKTGQDLDFARWAAQELALNASAKLIEGSNILEISVASDDPSNAKSLADGLRKAYVETTLSSRREAARRNAEWYEDQAEKAKGVLFQAEAEKAKFERENGILLGDDKIDIDSARLAALAAAGGAPVIAPPAAAMTPSQMQLAQLDAQLLEASKTLGPNHPTLLAMRRQRELLVQQANSERAAANAAASSAVSAARATGGLLEAQKAKVMAQREKVERLRLMQDEIDLRRDQYNKAVTRAAQLRQEADVAEAGAVPLASAVTPSSPVFPNKPLIIGAALAGGFGLGIAVALMMELFARRVRSADDLMAAIDAPVLAIIHSAVKPKKPWWRIMPSPGTISRLRTRAA